MTRHPATIIVSFVLCAAPALAQTSSGALQMPLGAGQAPASQPPVTSRPQTAPETQTPDDRRKTVASPPENDAEYHLGAGDLIEITVFGVEELRQTIRLNASGIVKLPLLDPIKAAGLTPAELDQKITALLADGVVNNPNVSVFVKEYRSQPVYVLGSVRSPGEYQVSVQLRVVDALSLAGGLLPTAGDEATIERPSPDGGQEIIKINVKELIDKGDLSHNIVVRGGDVLNVPERVTETVYVVGEVNRPGAFGKQPKAQWRVSQVLAYAGGPMKTAKLGSGVLIRYDETGARKQIPLDLGRILQGKQEDLVVRADDIIFVPSSNLKDVGYGILHIVPGMITSLPYMIP
jgi:polysaccharide export outer membrane protein